MLTITILPISVVSSMAILETLKTSIQKHIKENNLSSIRNKTTYFYRKSEKLIGRSGLDKKPK